MQADRPNPAFVLAFVVGREQALGSVKMWIKRARGFLTHSGLRSAKVDDVRGVYVPAYLYGAVAHSRYSASIGENYTVTHTSTDSQGRSITTTETRTEHYTLMGAHSAYVRDVVVTASRGVGNQELECVEPFDLRALVRYT